MFTGKRPWAQQKDEVIMMRVLRNQEKPPIPPFVQNNHEASDFLKNCLQFEPEKRWTASQLLNHPFAKITISGEN